MSAVVETRQGRVEGRAEGGVLAFRGIPYARPSAGARRFAPPEPAEPWAGVREASRFSPVAPQMGTEAGPVGKLFRLIRGGISEDCLYLNVWTSGTEGKRPVLVYLHGGAYVLGAGSTFVYSGTRFAESGVVLVTFNYRLGALGFLDLTRLASDGGPPANLGIRDQLAALEWVYENIAAFGGDPENITIYGESAGAMSAGVLLGLEGPRRFRRAILSSGAAANVSTPDEADYIAERFLAELAIPAHDWPRLREPPLDRILAAQRIALRGEMARFGKLPWQPTVDGQLIRRQPLESVRAGSAASVDLLIGTNREEWKLFTAFAPQLRRMGPRALRRRVARALVDGGGDPEKAEWLIAHHRERSNGAKSWPFDVWVAIKTDEYFLLPAIELAEAHALGAARTFFYRYDFPTPRMPRILGSCHGIELGVVFGSFRHPLFRSLYGNGAKVRRLSPQLGAAWASFARGERPGWDGAPEWPRYTPEGRETLVLDSESRPIAGRLGATRSAWKSGTDVRRESAGPGSPPGEA